MERQLQYAGGGAIDFVRNGPIFFIFGGLQQKSARTDVNKLSVSPIGTCRINTPLKRAQSRFPIEINLKRNYGYTHTSDEALQQLRFLQGDKQFREEVRPILFRPGRAIDSEHWEPSDLHIVEIAAKSCCSIVRLVRSARSSGLIVQ